MGVILVEVRVERNHSVAIWLYVLLREDVRHRMQRGLFPQTIWGEIVTDAWPLLVRLLTSYLLFSATRHFESKRKWFKKNLTRHRFIHCFFLFRSALLIWSWNVFHSLFTRALIRLAILVPIALLGSGLWSKMTHKIKTRGRHLYSRLVVWTQNAWHQSQR